MLWNWNTLDSCFLSESWHITSNGMLAGSCIGIICLVLLLEVLRRLQRAYDRRFIRRNNLDQGCMCGSSCRCVGSGGTTNSNSNSSSSNNNNTNNTNASAGDGDARPRNVPTLLQSALLAALLLLQLAIAYILMFLAMSYNGYVIVCIFIGSYIRYFILARDSARAAAM